MSLAPAGLKFGWHPERPSFLPRRKLADMLRVEDISPPAAYLMVDPSYVHVTNQGGTGSCVAHSGSGCIRDYQLAHSELDPPDPSILWGYRCRERHYDGDNDSGTYLSAYHAYLDELGWCTDKHWRWDEAKATAPDVERDKWINKRAPVSARIHAYDQRGTVREYAVPSSREAVKAALATKHPLHVGGIVTESWLNYYCPNGFRTLENTGAALGGHAWRVLGYDEYGVLGVNSWTRGWGFNGWLRVGWDTFLDCFRDRYAIRYVRRATS